MPAEGRDAPARGDIGLQHKEATEEKLRLREQVQYEHGRKTDTTLPKQAEANARETGRRLSGVGTITTARTLEGHTGKIYAIGWCNALPTRIVTASQDGRLIVWNALSGQKTHAIKLVCQWVMSCAYSPNGNLVASGGLDNVCSLFSLNNLQVDRAGNVAAMQFAGHKGYIACCRFVDDRHILTSSGDQTTILWDVGQHQRVRTFGGDATPNGHQSDVMSVSVRPGQSDVFVSGSVDTTAKLWDARAPNSAKMTFTGATMDINTVAFMSDGLTFGTGSDDSVCRIYDIRSGHELARYTPRMEYNIPMNATSIAFSHSGRLLFAGYSSSECLVWDTTTGGVVGHLAGHTGRVSAVATAPDGMAVCTGSWDKALRVFAPEAPGRRM